MFVFRPGEVTGDKIMDFAGDGALAGESLLFEGLAQVPASPSWVPVNMR